MSTETTVTELPKKHRKSRKEGGTILPDPAPLDDPTISNESPAPKSKKSQRSKDLVEDEDAALEQSEEEALKKSKKKKRRHDEEIAAVDVEVADDADGIEKKKKKRKRDKVEDGATDAGADVVDGGLDKKKKKRKQDNEIVEEAAEAGKDTAEDANGVEKKKKKHKKDKETTEQEEQEIPKPKSKKQKRKRVDTGLPNPEDDASLADQARKALVYAFTQFADPDNWKFNKARQNWLIRNIWSDQAIPELYMPLVTRYLRNVQGGVREKLVATCQSSLLVAPNAGAELPATVVETTGTSDTLKSLRARTILEVFDSDPKP
ncbi:hypothetical protein FIBSPDRAFT_799246 [Athelia psychrophila]|uniref:WKF domain-containing protein n=1 Tax=Athelia psychrophila TaxID=1759441 RepID=A0A166AY42_9AGAM|nr:hypothetical protein FIBSPDRAFT_799246 [Fibularhizoctonia sp. CBS 109695]